MKNLVLGIDPGLNGAAAFYKPIEKRVVSISKMPLMAKTATKKQIDPYALVNFLQLDIERTRFAVIELVSARPGQGVVSMFTFGQTLGLVQGMVAAFQIPLVLVAPQTWKTALRLPAEKKAAREKASVLFPCFDFSKASDDGRAEACLIALYGGLYHFDP